MASKGGGKIKSKGEHSPTKPYEQRKSFFQRITDSIKDVLRPSWLAADSADNAPHSSQTVDKSATAKTLQEKDDIFCSKKPSPECSTQSDDNPAPRPPLGPDLSVTPGNSGDRLLMSSGSSTGLWSVISNDAPGLQHQTPAASYERPGEMVTGRLSPFGSCGSAGHLRNASQRHRVNARGGHKLSRGEGGLSSAESSGFNRASVHSFTSPQWRVSQSSLSSARQQQLRQRNGQGSNSFSGTSESAAAGSPGSKRQRLWTPEASRKGRSLQPAVHDRPGFKMSVFRSSSLRESEPKSSLYLGKPDYGGAASYSRQSLNSSLTYQNSPPVRMSVTPKPVNKSGSAVLSSSATRILRTIERLSDAKRPRVGLQDSESLLSFTPSGYKTSRPLQKNYASHSKKAQSCVESNDPKSQEVASLPVAVSQVPDLSTVPAQKVSVDAIITDESSDDEDIQIIETPEEAGGSEIGPGSSDGLSLNTSKPKDTMQKAMSFRNYLKQVSQFHEPVKVSQSPCFSTSPVASGFAASPTAFVAPPAWGSTTPKPKSIIAGNSKSSAGNRKSVSFNDCKTEELGGSTTPPIHLISGSVMDVLGKSPECSSSSFKSPEQVNHKTASSSPAVSVGDSLFAKLAEPAGNWECEVCMLHNRPDLSKCPACQANKPGTGTSPASATAVTSSRSMPASAAVGSSTSVSPFLASPSVKEGGFGGVQLGSSSKTSVTISEGFKSPTAPSGAGGFTFGTLSSTSSSFPATGGFRLGTSASETVSSSSPAGFTFGKPNSASASKAVAASGFQFGGKDFSGSQIAKDSGLTSVTDRNCDSTLTATGFQFGVSSTSSISSKNMSSASLFGSPSATVSDTSESVRTVFGVSGRTVCGTLPQSERKNSNGDIISAGELTSFNTSHTDSSIISPSKSAPSLVSVDKTCDTASASPVLSFPSGAASSSTTGSFHFSGAANCGSSSSFVFGSSASTKVILNGSDSCVEQNTDLKTSSSNGGFSFGGSAKSEQSIPSPAAPTSPNRHNVFASSTPGSKGFVFGAPSLTPTNSSFTVSGAVPKPSVGKFGNELALSTPKCATNGEAEAVEKSAFSEGNGARASATVGFSFGAPLVQSKQATSGQNLFAPGKQMPLFGAELGCEGTSCETVLIDNDVEPDDVRGQHLTCSEIPAVDSDEPFKFASPKTITSNNTAFKFGHESNGPVGKEADLSFGSLASGVTGRKSGCGFSVQTNAASSKELSSSQAFLFGAGSGSTNTGQFSFSVGAGSLSNAAAASPLTSDMSAPVKGFSGATQPSVSFGADSSSNNSAQVFQFASPKSVDSAPAQSSTSSTFTSGQAAFSFAKSSGPAPVFTAPTTVSLVASPAQKSFNVGTGESPRKLRRAVRRIPKN